eukprot:TRINITY_DN21369_c0_g1_i2.p1 TRINITY_DN21369_c0_g1~~TRINITY_DN21369_c0_g1_i2.p1  ORF type:complete len:302 (+),score=60.94 TRINITY_DN21369_c0_g1_i2:34-939(+)
MQPAPPAGSLPTPDGARAMPRHSADVLGGRGHVRRVLLVTIGATLMIAFVALGGRPKEPELPGRPRSRAAGVHLIMVAGHAVLTARDVARVDDEESWFLQPSQKGQLSTYIRHIQKGVEIAAADPDSILVFSGGQTRSAAGPRSEALSYWLAAEAKGWFGYPEVRGRVVLEEFARDSFENLLFSLCRVHEFGGRYASRVTVVSYGYKRRRFAGLHRSAVRFPESAFDFVGVDPEVNPYTDEGNIQRFSADPYGCSANKELRGERNPFKRSSPYSSAQACPAMRSLLEYCGPGMHPATLPWN